MHGFVIGMGCNMSGYEAIMAYSCAVLTGSGPVALGLDPPFGSKMFSPDKELLDGLRFLNVTNISLLVMVWWH